MTQRRIYQNDYPYLITCNVIGKYPLFNKYLFASILYNNIIKCNEYFDCKILSFAILPSHFHIVLYQKNNNISQILMRIKYQTSKEIRKAGGKVTILSTNTSNRDTIRCDVGECSNTSNRDTIRCDVGECSNTSDRDTIRCDVGECSNTSDRDTIRCDVGECSNTSDRDTIRCDVGECSNTSNRVTIRCDVNGPSKQKTPLSTRDRNTVHCANKIFMGSLSKRHKNSIWQKSFNFRIINNEKYLYNVYRYVKFNWIKHNLPPKYSRFPYLYIKNDFK